jgi:hypothetical protein
VNPTDLATKKARDLADYKALNAIDAAVAALADARTHDLDDPDRRVALARIGRLLAEARAVLVALHEAPTAPGSGT